MELIDKTAVIAEIERRIKEIDEIGTYLSPKGVLTNLLCHLDTLEVKEVDLDFQMFAKEMNTVFNLPSSETENTEENPLNWEFAIAKHFFNIGLKQKEE